MVSLTSNQSLIKNKHRWTPFTKTLFPCHSKVVKQLGKFSEKKSSIWLASKAHIWRLYTIVSNPRDTYPLHDCQILEKVLILWRPKQVNGSPVEFSCTGNWFRSQVQLKFVFSSGAKKVWEERGCCKNLGGAFPRWLGCYLSYTITLESNLVHIGLSLWITVPRLSFFGLTHDRSSRFFHITRNDILTFKVAFLWGRDSISLWSSSVVSLSFFSNKVLFKSETSQKP